VEALKALREVVVFQLSVGLVHHSGGMNCSSGVGLVAAVEKYRVGQQIGFLYSLKYLPNHPQY
jgi:hypothetical protein